MYKNLYTNAVRKFKKIKFLIRRQSLQNFYPVKSNSAWAPKFINCS